MSLLRETIMKQILTYLAILLAGVGIGIGISHLFINHTASITSLNRDKIPTTLVTKTRKNIVQDTIEVKRYVNIPIKKDYDSTDQPSSDSQDTTIIDSLQNGIDNPKDDTVQNVLKEQLVSQQTVTLPKKVIDSSDVEELLDVKSKVFSDEIIVEFWDSPINLVGYQLTRNKLKLYGFNPNETVTLVRGKKPDEILLKTASIQVSLFKSNQFKSLTIK